MPLVDDNTGEVVREVIRTEEKYIPKLVEEKKPMLSASLDAQGYDIKSAGDIGAKTFNGIDIFSWVRDFVNKAFSELHDIYSARNHVHKVKDIEGLEEVMDRKTKGFQPEGDYASKDHKHRASEIAGIPEMIQSEIKSAQGRVEIRLDSQKTFLDKTVTGLAKRIDDKLDKDMANSMAKTLDELKNEFARHKKEYEKEISVHAQRIAALKEAEKEEDRKPRKEELVMKVYGAEDFLIPTKLDGMRITEVVGISTNEKEVDVQMKHNDQIIGLDHTVKTDEVISVYTPPTPTFVRITFHGQ